MNGEELKEFAKGGKICALTGHRKYSTLLNEAKLKEEFENLIQEGYTLFLCGMAIGFDTVCCRILFELRKTNAIRIIACIPFTGQEKKFTPRQQEIYRRYVEECNEKVVLYPSYKAGCFFGRNRYMVDESDVLVAHLYEEKGGTFYTVNYAKSKNKRIIYV